MLFIIAAAKSYCGLGDSKGYINLYVGTYTVAIKVVIMFYCH